MKKINFKVFGLFTDITKKSKINVDVRESFANILYCQTNGIKTHALALKIYNSDSEIEIGEDEANLIISIAKEYCTPAFIDGILEQLNKEDEK